MRISYWNSDVCSSDLTVVPINTRLGREDMRAVVALADVELLFWDAAHECHASDLKDAGAARSAEVKAAVLTDLAQGGGCDRADWSDTDIAALDRKSTRLNSSH